AKTPIYEHGEMAVRCQPIGCKRCLAGLWLCQRGAAIELRACERTDVRELPCFQFRSRKSAVAEARDGLVTCHVEPSGAGEAGFRFGDLPKVWSARYDIHGNDPFSPLRGTRLDEADVARGLELGSELLAAGLDDAASRPDMHLRPPLLVQGAVN